MRIPVEAREGTLEKRATKEQKSLWVSAIIVIVIFFILICTYVLTIKLRPNTKTRSKDKLPSLFSWKFLRKGPARHDYSTSLQDNELRASSQQEREGRDREMSGAVTDPERQGLNDNTGVDRNTSVRSVMTLPAYAPVARENERILAREGERGGIDTVIEFPETGDEEEGRREGEMESLYQIRLARRAEAQEREERRQARRDARARGDHEAVAEIRRRAEQAAEESVSQMLIAGHQTADRERRVSSVQYGDLGVARHDGTRIRANSSDSNRPLLDSAASISGQSGRHPSLGANTLHAHYRNASASSINSVSSHASEDFGFPEATHARSNDTSDDFEIVSLSHPRSGSASRVATPNAIPSVEIPTEQAPAYEDPPNYESPIVTRAPMLPMLERLPSIHITTEPTPVDGRPRSTTSR